MSYVNQTLVKFREMEMIIVVTVSIYSYFWVEGQTDMLIKIYSDIAKVDYEYSNPMVGQMDCQDVMLRDSFMLPSKKNAKTKVKRF